MANNPTFEFALRMGDNCLILGQNVSAWCGHAPILEEDIALANVSLDLIGQTRMWLGLAGEIEGAGRSADDLAFLRDVREFRNCLLVEQPNGDFGQTLMRQFLFDAWHHPMLKLLAGSADTRVAEIAEKSVKEAAYHLERSADLVIRLGDGSDESHRRMQAALDRLWCYTGELMATDAIDETIAGSGLGKIEAQYKDYTSKVFVEATLTVPEISFMQKGGKAGIHTEALGHMLADMQVLQRSHPGAQW
ncbi:MAG: phenylacetate-CoA oxygenase subunit PaaC [Alphaproteobacteria bacterium]|nr:phenylacetate-CoA oxygenase subunit PaaC [Alphaproteobacteria bacterium]